MLSTNRIQALFGGVLGRIYEGATLEIWGRSTVRDPETGTFPDVRHSVHPVKVQRDACTEAQREQQGYSAEDVRLMVLQSGLTAVPDTDSRIRYRNGEYRVMSVEEDPARVYWDCRARLVR